MTEEIKKNGAPKGNQNARKHGFYSNVLDESQQHDFQEAIEVEGFDEEIALLRVKIKSLVKHNPNNLRLITQAVNALCKLVMVKYDIRKEDKQGLREAINNVFKDIAGPLGIAIGTILKK
jgi:phage head maturation protease